MQTDFKLTTCDVGFNFVFWRNFDLLNFNRRLGFGNDIVWPLLCLPPVHLLLVLFLSEIFQVWQHGRVTQIKCCLTLYEPVVYKCKARPVLISRRTNVFHTIKNFTSWWVIHLVLVSKVILLQLSLTTFKLYFCTEYIMLMGNTQWHWLASSLPYG